MDTPDESSEAGQHSEPPDTEKSESQTVRLKLLSFGESYVTSSVIPAGPNGRSDVQMTDEQLAAAAAKGDDEAFTILFTRHHDCLIRHSRRKLKGDWDAAEEIAQATWVKAHTHLGNFDPTIRPFISWLHAIRIRVLIDFIRAREVLPTSSYVEDLVAFPMDRYDGDTEDALREAFKELPSELREAVRVTYLEDRSFPDAAKMLGCSVGCVHKRTVRAIHILREILGVKDGAEVKRLVQVKRRSRRQRAEVPTPREIQMMVA